MARFDGGQSFSTGGVLALHEIERSLGAANRLAACLENRRAPAPVTHWLADIIRFRLSMIAAGYEDGNGVTARPGLRAGARPVARGGGAVLAADHLAVEEPARHLRHASPSPSPDRP
ncbi:transposase [Paracraurococcus lichenis]|uniref:transposase n=1 Tax=Paracraurococcus lichenis TaxID=3064888 RepID=UPI00351D4AE6